MMDDAATSVPATVAAATAATPAKTAAAASANTPCVLYLVVPCYNEQEVLPHTIPLFVGKLRQLIEGQVVSPASKVLFVNDGSKDDTWAIIKQAADSSEEVEGLCLSRNRGHQNALLAGLMEARSLCDAAVSIDCDGQDDINAVDEMLAAFRDGCDVVYGIRSSRETDTAFKRGTAHLFYRLMNRFGAEVVYDHADYRLLSARVLGELARYREVNLFLRGMVPLVGFKSTGVYYEREERIAGSSKYPLRKMVSFAIDGITSLSTMPLELISRLGFVVSLLSLVGIAYALIAHLTGNAISGWTSMIMAICFFGGVQLLSIGIVGTYVGKTYLEAKRRPRYSISERTWNDGQHDGERS